MNNKQNYKLVHFKQLIQHLKLNLMNKKVELKLNLVNKKLELKLNLVNKKLVKKLINN